MTKTFLKSNENDSLLQNGDDDPHNNTSNSTNHDKNLNSKFDNVLENSNVEILSNRNEKDSVSNYVNTRKRPRSPSVDDVKYNKKRLTSKDLFSESKDERNERDDRVNSDPRDTCDERDKRDMRNERPERNERDIYIQKKRDEYGIYNSSTSSFNQNHNGRHESVNYPLKKNQDYVYNSSHQNGARDRYKDDRNHDREQAGRQSRYSNHNRDGRDRWDNRNYQSSSSEYRRLDRGRSKSAQDDHQSSSKFVDRRYRQSSTSERSDRGHSFSRMTPAERAKERFKLPVDGSILWKDDTLFTEMPEHIKKALDEKIAKDEETARMLSKSVKKEKKVKKKAMKEEDEASKILMQQFEVNQETFIGPRKSQLNARHNWSRVLLPGEGDAIAQYVSQNKRIPRRGEVGLTSEEIDQFEKLGYVMSGSKHRVIERVRQQKEALVMKGMVEEKERIQRGEKRLARENEVMGRFRNIVKQAAKKDS